MVAIDNSRALSPRIVYAAISFCIDTAAEVKTWYEERQTRKVLMTLSDRELDDIGLTRADVVVGNI
jgi:uncharacterized protein YjiS (DUF1127 family)